MDCKTSSNLMMSYLDDTISELQWKDLQAHFLLCENCQGEFELTLEMKTMIDQMEIISPTEEFEINVMNSIDLNLYNETTNSQEPKKRDYLAYLLLVSVCFYQGKQIWEAIISNISSLGGSVTEIVQNLAMRIAVSSLIVYPRQIAIFLAERNFQISWKHILIYAGGMLNLVVILGFIQISLYKMLKNKSCN